MKSKKIVIILLALLLNSTLLLADAQRDALVALYNSTDGDNWTNNSNWKSGDPCENEWYGVTCNGGGDVTSLRLFQNHLTGTIPTDIGNLTNLLKLDLAVNPQLIGTIPEEIGELESLKRLDLYRTGLTGGIPLSLCSLENLERLHLYSNQLTGSIPSEIGNLSKLQYLDLFSNNLTGSIPSSIGGLKNLKSLELYGNQLTGAIPIEIGKLSNLTNLILSENNLTGTIPSEIGDLVNLDTLFLQNNQLTGVIPSSLKNLSNLTIDNNFRLFGNNNIYTSDTDLQDFISDERGYSPSSSLTPYEYILSSNQYTIENDALIALYNSTTGEHWTNSYNWNSGHPCGDNWKGVQCNSEGNITSLKLGDNNLTGTIPPEIGNLTSLKYLHLYDNNLTGSIPIEIGNLKNLKSLVLTDNNLTGTIPTSIGNLINLKHLFLDNNQLTGSIPSSIGNLTNLKYLFLNGNELTGVIPSSITSLENLSDVSLRLYDNENLYSNDTALQDFIDNKGYSPVASETPYEYILSSNALEQYNSLMALYNSTDGEHWTHSDNWGSGHPCENEWYGVTCNDEGKIIILDLYGNKLTGTIPPEIGNLVRLETLMIDNNKLQGTIPARLKNLTNLIYLFLYNNCNLQTNDSALQEFINDKGNSDGEDITPYQYILDTNTHDCSNVGALVPVIMYLLN